MAHAVDVKALGRPVGSLRLQGIGALTAGVALLSTALAAGVIGGGMMISPLHPNDVTTGIVCLAVALSLFGAPGLLGIVIGASRLRRAGRLLRLGYLADQRSSLDPDALASELRVDRKTIDALLLEAWSSGALRRAPDASPASPAGPVRATLSASLVGRTLNATWRIVRHLGDGACGSVYEAAHVRIAKRTAVKVLHPDLRLSPDAIRRFEREAATASGLGHPGIVAVHDFDVSEDGLHFLVMELLEGETLEQHLAAHGALPWRLALDRGKQIASALGAAHTAGVLHRDLKPANVFLTRDRSDERVVLLDFGLAKPMMAGGTLTAQGTPLGTPAYMSPEQARGLPLDARSDVWSLGAVLYEMLTGAPPHLDATAAGVFAKILTEPTPQITGRDCPRELALLVERTLAKDPTARFADASAVLAALEACQRDAGAWPPPALA